MNHRCSSVQFSSVAQSCPTLWPHEPQHARLPFPWPTPGVHPNPCPLSWWCHPTISSSVVPFSSSFNLSQHQGIFQWVRSSHQVAKVLEFQLQLQSFQLTPRTDLLLGWTAWILQSKGLSRVFSNTTVQKHHSSVLSFLYSPTLTSIHDYWKNHSLDYMELCGQSNVSAF